jgi:hypothetical protein
MPSLTRFALNLTLFGLMVYSAMVALATFVRPKQHEIVTAIPVEVKFERKPQAKPRLVRTVNEIREDKRFFAALENLPSDFEGE